MSLRPDISSVSAEPSAPTTSTPVIELRGITKTYGRGDAAFQAQCLDTMRAYRRRGGTLLFVSHEPESVRQVCDRVIIIDAGAVVFDGGVTEGLRAYGTLSAARGIDVAGVDEHHPPEPGPTP